MGLPEEISRMQKWAAMRPNIFSISRPRGIVNEIIRNKRDSAFYTQVSGGFYGTFHLENRWDGWYSIGTGGDTNVQVRSPAPGIAGAKTDRADKILLKQILCFAIMKKPGSDPIESEVNKDVRYQN